MAVLVPGHVAVSSNEMQRGRHGKLLPLKLLTLKIIHNEGMFHVAGHLPASDGGGREAAYRYE
jgi:hypothetical protein